MEFIREGKSVMELMNLGKKFLGKRQVMPGVAGMLHCVQVEGTFPDGTKLVSIHDPICDIDGDLCKSHSTFCSHVALFDCLLTLGIYCIFI